MYNLIEYSDNYSYTSGRLWQFKRDGSPATNDRDPENVITANSTSFKYKSSLFKPLTTDDNGVFKNIKIAVLLKYLGTFWELLEMPLISCKILLEKNWSKYCVISTVANTTPKIKKHQTIRPNYYFIK